MYNQKISWKEIVRNNNRESFICYEVRIRYCDVFDYNYKISNIWNCFLHICSWGICSFYIDKLQPTSLVYHSSQLFSNWILNSPCESSNPMNPSEEELPATMNSPMSLDGGNVLKSFELEFTNIWWHNSSKSMKSFFLDKHR